LFWLWVIRIPTTKCSERLPETLFHMPWNVVPLKIIVRKPDSVKHFLEKIHTTMEVPPASTFQAICSGQFRGSVGHAKFRASTRA
jgi:hypothetical protein